MITKKKGGWTLEYGRAYREANKERIAAVLAAWRLKNPNRRNKYFKKWREKNIDTRMKREYGIDGTIYRLMLKSQKGRCAICNRRESNRINGNKIRLGVDHDHSTDQVRELLCSQCNTILGMARDSVAVLTAAIKYLRKHNKKRR